MIFLQPFFAALLASLVFTPLTIKLAAKFGFVDNPKTRKHPGQIHTKTVPRAGGLPIFLSVVLVSLFFLDPSKKLAGVLLGGLILVVVGLVDDRYDLPSWIKLLFQVLAALVVVLGGVGIPFIPNPVAALSGSGYEVLRLDVVRWSFDFFGQHSILILSDLFALFWIVWVVNMVNFSSGVDGQLPGIAIVSLLVIFAATLGFIAGDPSQITVSQLALIGVGATLGFMVFNFYPAKIFPGDSGSYLLGFLIAVCAVLSGVKLGTALLVMAVPLIDGVFTVVRRISARQSPFLGDRSHLHHHLLKLGWTQTQIALFYSLLCAILGSAALLLHSLEKVFALAVVAIIVLGGLLWLNMNLSQKPQK